MIKLNARGYLRTLSYHLKKIKRAIDYAVHGYNSLDIDNVYIWEDLKFKLKRIQEKVNKEYEDYELDDEWSEILSKQRKGTIQSLRLSIALLDRIIKDDCLQHPDDCWFTTHHAEVGKKNRTRLFSIMNKHSEGWWV